MFLIIKIRNYEQMKASLSISFKELIRILFKLRISVLNGN